MTKIIAFANQKGGAGKTTASINVSAGLVREGYRVLLVDLDSQAHCSRGLGYTAAKFSKTITDIFDAVIENDGQLPPDLNINEYILVTDEKIDFLPSNIGLASSEIRISNVVVGREIVLKEILTGLKNQYDYIILDCPPALGNITINALVATDYVIIPTEATVFAFDGTAQLIRTIEKVKYAFNKELVILGVFVTRYKVGTIHADEIIQTIQLAFDNRYHVFKSMAADSIRASESNGEGLSLFAYCPKEKVTAAYREVVKEIIDGTHQKNGQSAQ